MSADNTDERIQISDELVNRLKNYMNDPGYKEAVENSSSYNERLVKERKLRLPFIDAQTGVAQSDCYIWSSRLDRMPGYYSAQLYSYPARRWRKKRRQYLLNDNYPNNTTKEAEQQNPIETSSGTSGIVCQEAGNSNANIHQFNNTNIVQNGNCISINSSNSNSALNDIFEDSKDSWLRYEDDGSDLPDAGELDDPESDYDDYEEYSSRKKKSKRKETVKKKRSEYSDSEKPYQCELCGARYKTRPGLSYHYSHSHQDNNSGSNGALSSGNNGSIVEEESFFSSVKNSSHHSHLQQQQCGNKNNNNNNLTNQTSQQQPQSSNTSSNQSSPLTTSHLNSISLTSPVSLSSNHLPNNSSTASSSTITASASATTKTINQTDHEKDNNNRKDQNKKQSKSRASPSNYCDFCLGDSQKNIKTQEAEELVSCSDCGRSAHPTCLQFTSNMILSVKKYRWQCIECKSCGLCGTSDNDEQLLFCDDCDRGYHMYCLKPPLKDPPEGSWSCHLCIEEYHMPKKDQVK